MWWAQHTNYPFPGLLGPWFSARRKWLVPVAVVVTLALILGCAYLGGWAISRNYGYTGYVQRTILMEEESEPPADGNWKYPRDFEVKMGMRQVEDTFEVDFRRCTLWQLTYDEDYSDSVQEALARRYEEQYPGVSVFVITSTFTTGDKKVPEGLEPNTTYEDYPWVLGNATGNAHVLEYGYQVLPE